MLTRCDDADMVELRLDALPDNDASALDWKHLHVAAAKPLLVTYRLPSEGGFFTGSVEHRAKLYQAALDAGVEFFDVEASSWLALRPLLRVPAAATLVLSHHLFEPQTDPVEPLAGGLSRKQMESALDALFATPTDEVKVIYKFIFTASSVAESGINAALVAQHGLRYAQRHGKRLITHAMGEAGEPSRILGAVDRLDAAGNAWTYCALDASSSTASGQITLHEARNVYRLHEKTPQTRIFGLVGNPTKQSKGKFLHNALAARLSEDVKISNRSSLSSPSILSQNFLYFNVPTANADDFWLRWCEANIIDGFSVTIPHKEAMFQHCNAHNAVSPLAARVQACNTVTTDGKAVHGANTDVLALVDCLRPHAALLQRGTLIIGTGATTQSTITALQELDVANIIITGRNQSRGKQLANQYSCRFVEQDALARVSLSLGGILQTTPVGMFPTPDAVPLPADVLQKLFTPLMLAMDVIYNPVQTCFLAMAQEAGCITLSGEEMFIRQAAHQFSLFTGVAIELALVRDVWQSVVIEH